MNLIPDNMDLDEYMGGHELRAKVRPASDFADELRAKFGPKSQRTRHASMFSTKLRNVIEFRPGEVTIWAGYNGHRKSMFVGQVALDLCAQRERVLIASMEMLPAVTLERMTRQALAGSEVAGVYVERFLQWSNDRLWLFDHLGRVDGERIEALCRYFADKIRGAHVVIDSMMMVCQSEEHLDEQKRFMTDMVRLSKETGQHIHVIAHCRKPNSGEDRGPTKYDIRGSASVSDQADNVVTLWVNKPKAAKLEKDQNDTSALAEPDYLVSVEKQRNGSFEGKAKMWFHEDSMRFCDDRTSIVEPYALEVA